MKKSILGDRHRFRVTIHDSENGKSLKQLLVENAHLFTEIMSKAVHTNENVSQIKQPANSDYTRTSKGKVIPK